MTGRNRCNFSPRFRLEVARRVLDQHDTVADAATAMNAGKFTMDKWVRQLNEEQGRKSPTASPTIPEQIERRELSKNYRVLDVRLPEKFSLVEKLRVRFPVAIVCMYLGSIAAVINTGGNRRRLMPHAWY